MPQSAGVEHMHTGSAQLEGSWSLPSAHASSSAKLPSWKGSQPTVSVEGNSGGGRTTDKGSTTRYGDDGGSEEAVGEHPFCQSKTNHQGGKRFDTLFCFGKAGPPNCLVNQTRNQPDSSVFLVCSLVHAHL